MARSEPEIILKTYDTIADQSLWPSVLDILTDQLNAHGCIIFEWDNSEAQRKLRAPLSSGFFEQSALDKYIDRCFEYEAIDQDVFEAHSLKHDGIDLIDDSVLANSVAELKQRKNVEILQKFGILHRAAGLLNKDNILESRFSVQLSSDRGPLTPDERQYLSFVLPHVAKALDLGRPAKQLAIEHNSMLSAMDRLIVGVCILDAKGQLVHSNEEFKRQLDTYNLFSVTPTGELKVQNEDNQKRFAELKADARHHGHFGARPRKEAINANSDTILCMEVAPLTRSEEMGSSEFGGFILYSTDTSLPIHCNTGPIQQAYGLTDAEIALVDLIADGLTNPQIAELRERSVSTINAQVKTILSKTNCANRTQFVRLMMSFGVQYLVEPK